MRPQSSGRDEAIGSAAAELKPRALVAELRDRDCCTDR